MKISGGNLALLREGRLIHPIFMSHCFLLGLTVGHCEPRNKVWFREPTERNFPILTEPTVLLHTVVQIRIAPSKELQYWVFAINYYKYRVHRIFERKKSKKESCAGVRS